VAVQHVEGTNAWQTNHSGSMRYKQTMVSFLGRYVSATAQKDEHEYITDKKFAAETINISGKSLLSAWNAQKIWSPELNKTAEFCAAPRIEPCLLA
jgi:hypothetical protein